MPVSAITHVIVRLFALYWIVQGIAQGVSLPFTGITSDISQSLLPVVLVYLATGLLLWFFAPKLCRVATGKYDPQLTLAGITSEQLFTAVLLGLGTWFLLSSIGKAINWTHFFVMSRHSEKEFGIENTSNFYDLSESLLTLVAAIALLFASKSYARKLTTK